MNVQTLLDAILSSGTLREADRKLIVQAYDLAEGAHEGQTRASGEPYIQHCLAVAHILADLRIDTQTIVAGLLHDVVEDSKVSVQDLEQAFGPKVARLVDGVTKLKEIELERFGKLSFNQQELESLRKMFLAMFTDIEVVIIKLADRLHNMRTLRSLSTERQRRIARETLEFFAPLANRLGIWQWKWELEDLGFRYLEPNRYKKIASWIAERRPNRETSIKQYVATLRERLAQEGINGADISGRPKHIYSIYRKMERKGLPFEQIYDIRGVRVIVDNVSQCYVALGVVHELWPPIPGEFDDYIATPKDNQYRSLHTAVVASDGKTLEVQIRTWDMHRTAEYGIASHWRYKERGRQRDAEFERKVNWIRQMVEWLNDVSDSSEFVDSLRTDVFQDRVYTFTPQGDVIDLPAGSTPIDFAFHIHTEIGYRCRGAKVNGKLVSLDYQLQNGDKVEILTAKRGGPSRDWLNPILDYVKTSRARTKIRQWFRRQQRDENIAQGRVILERELKRLGLSGTRYETVAHLFGHDTAEELMLAVGSGDVNVQQIANRVAKAPKEETDDDILDLQLAPPKPLTRGGITVLGTGGLLTRMGQCCNPVPGDQIIGYVTRGRGVTIHRQDCPNVLRIDEKERLIEVEWGQERETYPARIQVSAYNRSGLLNDVTNIVAAENINITRIEHTNRKNIITFDLTLEIIDLSQLMRVLVKIESLANVVEARRLTS